MARYDERIILDFQADHMGMERADLRQRRFQTLPIPHFDGRYHQALEPPEFDTQIFRQDPVPTPIRGDCEQRMVDYESVSVIPGLSVHRIP